MARMIGTTVTLVVSQGLETTYDWVVDADAPIRFIHSHGLVPGFQTYELLNGDWRHEGASRQVTLADGTTLTESIKTSGRPTYFAYTLNDIAGSPLADMLMKRAYGQWWFESTPLGTHVKWRYAFEAKSQLLNPVLWLFMHTAYRSYMKAALRKMKRFSETTISS